MNPQPAATEDLGWPDIVKIDGVAYDLELPAAALEGLDDVTSFESQPRFFWRIARLARKAEAWVRKERRALRAVRGREAGRLLDDGKGNEARSQVRVGKGASERVHKGFRYTGAMLKADLDANPLINAAQEKVDEAERIAGTLADLRETLMQRHESLLALSGGDGPTLARRRRESLSAFSPTPVPTGWGGKEEEDEHGDAGKRDGGSSGSDSEPGADGDPGGDGDGHGAGAGHGDPRGG